MELREFVSQALVQILEGISDAQESTIVKETSAGVVAAGPGMRGERTTARDVEFDVAITTQSGTETKGKAGLLVGTIGLGTQGASANSRDLVHRIRFSVPVVLPRQKK